jgi:hypothetical protein
VAGRDAKVGPGWVEFEARLAAALERMKPDTFLVLTVSTPRSEGPGPYVQYAHSGRRGFRAEASGNHFLVAAHALSPEAEERLGALGWQWPEPAGEDDRNFHREWPNPAPWTEIAALTVQTLRDVFGVAMPTSLRFLQRGFPTFAGRLPRLDLGIPADRSPRGGPDVTPPGPVPALTGLNRRLEDALKAFLGLDDLIRDADGDIPVRVGSALMFVRAVPGTPPLVQLFAHVLDDVDLTLPLLEAINDTNRRILFGRIFWAHRVVIVAMEITGVALEPEQVSFACVQLGILADHLDDELAARFGRPDGDRPKRPLVN